MARSDYTLAVYDDKGQERKDEQGNLGSEKAAAQVKDNAITDVFLMSHGWQADIPSAIASYNGWTDALMQCPDDIARLKTLRPGFTPLMVGFHWPSQPWGDEQTVLAFDFNPAATIDPVADFTTRLGGTAAIGAAVQKVFAAVGNAPTQDALTPELLAAYHSLDQTLSFGASGPGSVPEADRLPFDAQRVFEQLQAPATTASFAGFSMSALLRPLRVLSYWSMKARARSLGESGAFNLLLALQRATQGRDVRFHLMGHSFGCIVVSSMMAGPRVSGPATSPVHSAVLVEGAMSLWSYAFSIPKLPGVPGYYSPIVRGKKVLGPIATTQSHFDTAVGLFYPVAAGLVAQADFGALEFPLFGGVALLGLQGVDNTVAVPSMLDPSQAYDFKAGQVYNVQSDNVIKTGGGLSGAHSDILHPAVGHLVWQAAMTPV